MGFGSAYHALLKNHPFATWSTARLEGLNFTFPEVQTIVSGMTVGGHPLHDLDEVRAIAAGWGLVVGAAKEQKSVTRELVEEINGTVSRTVSLDPGTFRSRSHIGGADGTVRTPEGDYRAPGREELEDLWEWWEAHAPGEVVERALIRVPFMARSQFFWDGNKRTSVMAASLELVTHGFMPLTVSGNRQLEWHQALTELFIRDDATDLISVLGDSAQPL
ncbi:MULTISPECIES: Fic family protein [unclassified Corynebacterium]|uniref:Fic family protein n=1 Tax=unclassified Corynebacterium TaxID=2624378 RepID=UPI0029CA31AA|nr:MULTISPECIES: Fic family protein [unclassified Corynebacterium]WPF66173.1 Fic family protein [Corynebacterium sp. 22KM0430]WPF68665.1 Fic family protein [Corynebacterium sp. 21KM1197]